MTITVAPERAVDATSCVVSYRRSITIRILNCLIQTAITVTLSGTNAAATGGVTITVGDLNPSATGAPAPSAVPPANGNIGDFGKCSVPEMEFGVGFDNRKETSFRPIDRGTSYPASNAHGLTLTSRSVSFSHGSAQNEDIITRRFIDYNYLI